MHKYVLQFTGIVSWSCEPESFRFGMGIPSPCQSVECGVQLHKYNEYSTRLHSTASHKMTATEYYLRVQSHPSSRSGSSNPRVESNIDQHQEITTDDVSVDTHSIYVLSDPPAVFPIPSVPYRSSTSCSTPAAFSPLSRLMPRNESKNSSTGAIPGSSIDVTHDWECVRSVRRLSANTDVNGDSECSIEEWDCTLTSHDTMPLALDESESLSLDEDGDALHAHRWDLIPEYRAPLAVPRDTLFPHMHGRPLESRRPPPERWQRSACSAAPTLPPAPHPRIRLPLLSFFVSLLSIDDATLHLVAHSPAHSTLFPGPIHPCGEGTRNAQEVHGVLALLEPSRQHAGLRDGLAVACDESILPSNPFKISASPFTGLLGLVREICAGGRAALREVNR
ncbi:hypothetical protein F5888DRAFT_1679221 [Russula emetica]|nr:hypothetical protein F5888DRAFT_1679221 [Russula emetica]